MWPFLPDAQPLVALTMASACRLSDVPPVDCVAHVVPLKKSMSCPSHAAHTWVLSIARTAWCLFVVPPVCVDQVLELFENTMAVSPTAQMCVLSSAVTPLRLEAVPDV